MMRFKRLITVGTSVVAMSAMTAGPALAHYCYKSGWNANAAAGAANSQAWMTAADWGGLIQSVREIPGRSEECLDALDEFEASFAAFGSDTLFMGPGLLAGGAVSKGKKAGRSGIGHLDHALMDPIFIHCFGDL